MRVPVRAPEIIFSRNEANLWKVSSEMFTMSAHVVTLCVTANLWKVSSEMFTMSAHVVMSCVTAIRYRLEPRAPYIFLRPL